MPDKIHEAIREEAEKLIQRHQRYASTIAEDVARFERRSGVRRPKTLHVPSYWDADPGFNPYYVRSRAKTIAYAIRKRLQHGTYSPRPAVAYEVPKAGGGVRRVSVFQVADNAISRLIFKSLMEKNASRLSARCYSYRTDITLHDAVLHIASEFSSTPRLFVAEFDFSKYFDSIAHVHIERILRDRRFYLTAREEQVIWSFLRAGVLPSGSYGALPPLAPPKGIPQGTSVSLFLANVAAYPLDHRLERIGVGFVRYADDTLIWSEDYGKICVATDLLHEAATDMGVEVNLQKSEGISILASAGSAVEFRSKSKVEFVGYSIGRDSIGIKQSSLRRIKERISYLIYSNLLEAVQQGHIVAHRFANPVDRDYYTMILQIRRFLYGDLSEAKLRRYLAADVPKIHYQGLMSFYPIVDDDQILRKLDGWMLHTIFTSLRRRSELLRQAGHAVLPSPHGVSKRELIRLRGQTTAGTPLDLRMPSFSRISKLMRKASQTHGANAVAHPRSGQYYPV